ncbi:LysR family transcriptional regulator [Komagataeibacter xylinus]|uniref:LysR family transcriptional regulator n=1 Tax=Komagataeibacter xylinus TaxID=28448 RepID=A0A318PL66_KOMXY|nr:LysR substrate-binding domain-containing protein [Komagataeibacter xylinus]AZV39816.1 LysR family transcriptional regulator [Komagataeibacter xylinus]PYD56763.1 LysR family transcriptional regulator [Komagataeibacter xylinus]GBQ74152.1 LysR family transcriptional regulator [Komagataeibacter xylinus NBRC 15237]
MDMRHHIPPLAALNAFVAYARTGGIRRAAVALGVDHAVVSRHLRDLENALGVALRDRSIGGLTPEGHEYHARIAPLLDGLARATADMRGQRPHLTLTCSHGIAYHWLLPRLASFRQLYPGVDLMLRPVDSDCRFNPDPIDTVLHADIRYIHDEADTPLPPRICARPVARPPVFPVASPACLHRLAHPLRQAADLLHAPLLIEDNDTEWRLWFRAQSVNVTHVTGCNRLWQAHLALAAARAGEGIALANAYLLEDDLLAGRLVRVSATDVALREVSLGAYVLRATKQAWQARPMVMLRTWLETQFDTDSAEAVTSSHH